MNSRIYSGKVMHARQHPVRHNWVFPFYFYALDLDELAELNRTVWGFGHNHWRPVNLRDRDYLQGTGNIRTQLAEFIDLDKDHRIILITVARFIGKVFNPVSFYYVLDEAGSPINVVAEVNNTFGERHLYPLTGGVSFPLHCRHDKQFHVSPFNSMEGHYEFTFSEPGDELSIEIKLIRNGTVVMDAAMWGHGVPLTTPTLWKTVLRQPFSAALTMPRILWQAALLHFKLKLPVFKKPDPTSPLTIKANV